MISDIFKINTDKDFNEIALQVFRHQANNCSVYRDFIELLKVDIEKIFSLEEIPFLPIQFFKSHQILSSKEKVEQVFLSSGTGGTQSKHHITDLKLYEESYIKGFQHFYGDISGYTILALLPSYLEREGSSLIYMVDDLIHMSNCKKSGFFLDDIDQLISILKDNEASQQKTLLIGVSFALLDLIEKVQLDLNHTIVMETGGMKGRRKEMIREELHVVLKEGFGVPKIHSEYGMTELLSQGYSKGNGVFECPPWMKIMIRDTEDALTLLPKGKTGGVNVIDLANYNSCSFIATQDLGKVFKNNSFEVLGRFDHSDIRGCNLLIT